MRDRCETGAETRSDECQIVLAVQSRAYPPYHTVDMEYRGMENGKMQRWYVEWLDGSFWRRTAGRWVFEAAVVKARELAITKATTTRLVKVYA